MSGCRTACDFTRATGTVGVVLAIDKGEAEATAEATAAAGAAVTAAKAATKAAAKAAAGIEHSLRAFSDMSLRLSELMVSSSCLMKRPLASEACLRSLRYSQALLCDT